MVEWDADPRPPTRRPTPTANDPTSVPPAFARLRVWEREGERAPHKPLLVLLALGRWVSGEQGPLRYSDVEDPLRNLLTEFGPPRRSHHPEFPFWYLKNDGVWVVSPEAGYPPRKGHSSPSARQLREAHAAGQFTPTVRLAFEKNPALISTIARQLLDAHFPATTHEDILAAVGLDTDSPFPAKVGRDRAFREAVLVAYGYACAVCGAGVRLPENTKLAPKPEAIKDWDKLSADEKKLFTRQMEVFAGFGEHTDHEVGRLVGAIEEMGQLDNTLFVYILGDNGASAEGGMVGLFNEMNYFNQVPEELEDILKKIDQLGGRNAYNHYAAGWAVAGDTPFTWTKQIASSFGGTRNGTIVHWPKGIKAKNEVRSQFHHVTDITPTVLEACGLPEPKEVNGFKQRPIEGVSMMYTFDDARAKDRHTTQYFEIFCNRAIHHDGWVAGTVHTHGQRVLVLQL